MKKCSLLLIFAMLLALLSACAAHPTEPAPTRMPSDTPVTPEPSDAAEASYPIEKLTIGTSMGIETAVRGEYNYDMLASAVTELPLVWQDTHGDYHPLLADYATEDAQTWVYTVREGLMWDDGEPVTADDLLFTLEYEDESEGRANLTAQTDAEGKVTEAKYRSYAVSDDHRSLTLTLTVPNVRELSNMTSFRVMPKHIYEGKAEVTDAEARIGCGPYRFVSFSRESGSISFEANPLYPEQPKVKTLVYRLFGNDDTLYLALKSGDLDLVWNYASGVPAAYQDVLAADSAVQLLSAAAPGVPAVLGFNNAEGFFAEENLRLAVAYALDYAQFPAYFGSTDAITPQRGFVPPATLGYTETEALVRDADAAAKYMAAAGYEAKNADGFYVNATGDEAAFTLTYNASKETHAGVAELLKTQLEAFGIRVTLDGADKDAYNAKTSNKFSGNHITMEAAVYGFTAAGMGMGSGLGSIYADGNHAVQGGCQVFDAEFRAILERMNAAATPEDYCEHAAALQTYYAAHVPFLALYWDAQLYAVGAAYTNLTADSVFGLNNAQSWYTVTKN